MYYQSTKLVEGFSTCFRQWKAKETHCSFLHGYAIKFKLVFASETLDDRNWVQDFGFLTRTDFKFDGLQLKEWFKFMFDHTTVVAKDDPFLTTLKQLSNCNVLDLRVLDRVGCEAFAELVFVVISLCLKHENKNNNVKLVSVECIENEKNSAIFCPANFNSESINIEVNHGAINL